MIDPKINGKVALITGANSGIGASIAQKLAEQGVNVIIHYLQEANANNSSVEHTAKGEKAARDVVQSIEKLNGEAAMIDGNLMDNQTINKVFNFAEEVFGPVEILVNNAAHCELPDTIYDLPEGSIQRHFKVNTEAAVLLIKEYTKRYSNHNLNSGKIINISTDSAQNFPTQISYGASKAALEAYTRSLAIELGTENITVNCIAPGPVQTGWIDEELKQKLLPSIPLGTMGKPEDIAECVVFLSSKQARWITGQVIKISGGHAL